MLFWGALELDEVEKDSETSLAASNAFYDGVEDGRGVELSEPSRVFFEEYCLGFSLW